MGASIRDLLNSNVPGSRQMADLDLTGILGGLPESIAALPKTLFLAPLNALAVGVGLTLAAQFRADPSHDFVGYLATFTVRNAATGAVIADPNVLVRFFDEQNKLFSPANNALTELRNVAGPNAGAPGLLPVPLIVARGTAVNAEFTNGEAVAVNIRLTIIGFNAGNRA